MTATAARTAIQTTATDNGWYLDSRGGSDVYSRGEEKVAARWSTEGRLTNVGHQTAGAAAYSHVKGGRAALAALLATEVPAVQAPEAPAPVQDEQAKVERPAQPAEDASVERTGFRDSLGADLYVGDRVTVTARGNNVRAKDLGQSGTVTGASRSRVKVTWDALEDAPWKAILPGLVTRQD